MGGVGSELDCARKLKNSFRNLNNALNHRYILSIHCYIHRDVLFTTRIR